MQSIAKFGLRKSRTAFHHVMLRELICHQLNTWKFFENKNKPNEEQDTSHCLALAPQMCASIHVKGRQRK